MAFCIESVLRRISSNSLRKFSTVVEPVTIQEDPLKIFRTSESNPANHTKEHLRRFYSLPSDIKQKLYQHGGFRKQFENDVDTFGECCIMVRKPAIEIISYLRQADYTKPVNKYVLYGGVGCGKTISLAHILHYGLITNHVLIHVPWVLNWFRFPKEVSNSVIREGLMDLPIEAATWLAHFRFQNKHLLPALDIRVSKDYVWSQRETTPSGAPILEMIEFGINRVKFASEVIFSLMDELKQASIAGNCKTMVVIDGFNAFYSDCTRIKNENKVFVPARQVTLSQAFINITKCDWNHGAVILSVDKTAVKDLRDSDLPRYLLQKEGFEHLDPFLPVAVENYDNDEFDMVVEYYKDRKWLRDITPNGQRELQLLTVGNPLKLTEYCTSL